MRGSVGSGLWLLARPRPAGRLEQRAVGDQADCLGDLSVHGPVALKERDPLAQRRVGGGDRGAGVEGFGGSQLTAQRVHFGLGRAKIREMAFAGEIPGVTKASW